MAKILNRQTFGLGEKAYDAIYVECPCGHKTSISVEVGKGIPQNTNSSNCCVCQKPLVGENTSPAAT